VYFPRGIEEADRRKDTTGPDRFLGLFGGKACVRNVWMVSCHAVQALHYSTYLLCYRGRPMTPSTCLPTLDCLTSLL
jgi:hypothetical protein